MSDVSPRTVVEFADYEGIPEDGKPLPHKTARIYINGQQVRVEKNSVEVVTRSQEATTVTLTLLPDEVRFVREPEGEKGPEPEEIIRLEKPESKFKEGDRVRVRKDAESELAGKSGEIVSVHEGRSYGVRLAGDAGGIWFAESSLEPESKFKEGDRVRHLSSGRCGTLQEETDFNGFVLFDGDPSSTRVLLENLEPESDPWAGSLYEDVLSALERQPEPVVVQGAWTLAERERRRSPILKLDASKIVSGSLSSEGLMLSFDGDLRPLVRSPRLTDYYYNHFH